MTPYPLPAVDEQTPKLKYNETTPKARPGSLEFFAEWFAQQPPEVQQEYTLRGLAPEVREGDGNFTFEVDPEHKDWATHDEPYQGDDNGHQDQRTYTEDEVQEVIRRVVMAMQMSESPDCLFQARCILIAFGIGEPPTETELAKQKGCSRQFVSKKVKRIQEMFNLSPSQFMRSEAACAAYARAWERQHNKRNASKDQRKRPAKGLASKGVAPTSNTLQMGLKLDILTKDTPTPISPPGTPSPGLRNLFKEGHRPPGRKTPP